MSGRSPFDNLTGLAALSEIGRRLGDLGDKVRDTLKDGGSGEMRSAGARTESFSGGVAQSSFRIRTLSGGAAGGPSRRGGGMAARAERAKATAPDLDGAREPLVDCFDEGDAFVVTAELPGVQADEITLMIDEGAFAIETTGARRYRARQPLPTDAQAGSLSQEFRNGILVVRIAKLLPNADEPMDGAKP